LEIQAKLVADNVTSIKFADTGHWLVEQRPAEMKAARKKFLVPPLGQIDDGRVEGRIMSKVWLVTHDALTSEFRTNHSPHRVRTHRRRQPIMTRQIMHSIRKRRTPVPR
jgi:hypothetical protein